MKFCAQMFLHLGMLFFVWNLPCKYPSIFVTLIHNSDNFCVIFFNLSNVYLVGFGISLIWSFSC